MRGNLYRTGQSDLPRDPEKAFEAYLSGALLGSGNAMNNVARCYRQGDGVAADAMQARSWLLHAAALENPWALLRLGQTAARDDNLDVARRWLTRAVRAGSRDAETALAVLEDKSPPRPSPDAS
jgi:TPR repeat protein